jgi:hypothetical protein
MAGDGGSPEREGDRRVPHSPDSERHPASQRMASVRATKHSVLVNALRVPHTERYPRTCVFRHGRSPWDADEVFECPQLRARMRYGVGCPARLRGGCRDCTTTARASIVRPGPSPPSASGTVRSTPASRGRPWASRSVVSGPSGSSSRSRRSTRSWAARASTPRGCADRGAQASPRI